MKISEFAQSEGITVQRATRLAREGRIPARKVSGVWEVDESASIVRRSRRRLSEQSRSDVLRWMNFKTFDGITGVRKARAAARIREFINSPDPVSLLRDWWAGSAPEGRGGAAVVRAAQRGYDQQVRDAQKHMGMWVLDSPDSIRGRISDWRAIRGVSAGELAERADVPTSVINTIERTGYSPRGNRDVARIVKTLRIPAVHVRAERSAHA